MPLPNRLLHALCLTSALLAACTREYALDLILLDRPANLDRLVPSIRIGGQGQTVHPGELPATTTRLWIPIPNQQSGSMEVTINGQTVTGCTAAQWQLGLELPVSEQLIHRELPRIGDGMPQCLLTIKQQRMGHSTGTIRVDRLDPATELASCDAAECPPIPVAGKLRLTATPGRYAKFERWQGDCSGSQECTVDATRPLLVTAVFSSLCTADDFCPETLSSGTTPTLNFVKGRSPDDVWMVGENSTVLHWNGTALFKEDIPTTTLKSGQLLNGVDLLADGSELTIVGQQSTVIRRSMGVWSKHSALPESEVNLWTVIMVPESTPVVLTGGASGRVFRKPLSDSIWQRTTTPDQPLVLAVAADPTGYWVGGSDGRLRRYDYPMVTWREYCENQLAGSAIGSLRGIILDEITRRPRWVLDVSGLYEVDWSKSPEVCRIVYQPQGSELRRMALAPDQRIWIVGEKGLLVTYEPASMKATSVQSGTTGGLYGVYAATNNEIWTVGEGGQIRHRPRLP